MEQQALLEAQEAEAAREEQEGGATGEETVEKPAEAKDETSINVPKIEEPQPEEVATPASSTDVAATGAAEPATSDGLEKILEEDEGTNLPNGGVRRELTQSKVLMSTSTVSVEVGSIQPSLVPPSGPETLEFIEGVKKAVDVLRSMQSNVISLTGAEPALIEINKPSNKGNNFSKIKIKSIKTKFAES